MQDLSEFESWCRDPRSMTFGEFLHDLHRQNESGAPVSPVGLEMAVSDLYLECRCRIDNGDRFAIGYVQFDHFKEYSERYGRDRCARVISLVDRILRDVVAIRCRTDGFVTQIGKVAFTFVVPVDAITDVCVQVLDMFDSEIPLQYDWGSRFGATSEQHPDGDPQRIRVIELKIGVVTNDERSITDPTQMSELAMHMLTYAMSQAGSVFVVDRRHEPFDA